ncbi:MAG: hypothetical protein FP814_15200 [Desulfobacterium sp.]|nr:hypothetical protein [Desulfobacterium sp.]MBU3950245.1 hypothetical protein [Pseudomonadota bacterium]MBU4035010.1 hypothetical protein [Pseudomonadota bacterium]
MSVILKIKLPIIFIYLILLILLSSFVFAHGQATAYEYPGKVFINIYDGSKFVEFILSEGNLVKTTDGKVSRFKKDDRTYETSWTEDFKKLYYANRIYRYDMEEKLASFFSQYDLENLQNIQTRFFKSMLFENKEEFRNENIYLTGPGRKPKYFIDYTYGFNPNKQFSHVIYNNSSGVLINVATMRVTFPFGIDDIQNLDWSSNGQFVAYSFQGYKSKYMLGDRPEFEIRDRDHVTLVIIDIINEKSLLKKILARNILPTYHGRLTHLT